MKQKEKVLVFADWYEPGYKAGGPIRSCVNFTQHMKKTYDIYVFTSDRDLGSTAPYEGITADSWIGIEPSVHLFYSSPSNRSFKHVKEQISHITPDFIYLNSMFSLHFTLFPLWVVRRQKSGRPKIILSPRGMLRSSAISFKPLKKKLFLKAFRSLGFSDIIHFHASDEEEQKDIRLHFGQEARVSLISNLPAVPEDRPAVLKKEPGQLSMIFVGRIHPIKNLDYLLRVLSGIPQSILLTIVGNLEDKVYWQKCQQIISDLPPAVEVRYIGEMPNDQIAGLIQKHHIFALPTRGENFGHAIFESLSSKRPVLISDQTPWRQLAAAKAGWDIALQAPADFEKAILQATAWDQLEFENWADSAFRFARAHRENSGALEKYIQLFS